MIRVAGIAEDFTQRKQAENERARLIRSIEQVGESIVITDLNGSILYVNPAFEKLTGYTRDEAIGQNPRILKSGQHPASYYQEMWATLQDGEAWSGELINRRKDGTLFQEDATISPIKDKDGKIINYVAVKRDITSRKRVEAELAQAKDKAEAANRAKSEFLANMSHEIRTPMNGVIGMLELVLDTSLQPDQKEYLTMARGSSESLLAIINDILDFSKIEAGKLELEEIDFNLHEVVSETLKTLSLRAHQKRLELACSIDTRVPEHTVGDPGRLRQILINLVGNAIKFTSSGEIVVSVTCRSRNAACCELQFNIADSGIGIPKEKQAAIFEAFTQADNSTTRQFGGTGLGLPISALLVKMMGGTVWVESVEGQGSTFRFTAKLKTSSLPASSSEETTQPHLANISVLVVDDNETNRRILSEMVGSWGMHCRTAASASEALQILRDAHNAATPYRIVLTDCRMPGMDGFDFANAIRQDPNMSEALILMLTSADRNGDMKRCRELGIDRYLVKPIGKSELFNTIVAVLEGEMKQLAPETPAPAPRPTSVNPHPSLHILIAEDNPVNQMYLRLALEKMGHTTATAVNGREVIQRALNETFDLVFMDVQMPEMDGLAATAQIRDIENRRGGHIPIVAMTAHALDGDQQRCLAAGMDGYISKPAKLLEIATIIEAVYHSADIPVATGCA
jgi:PAS domain S-box-containing protein